MTLPVFLRTTIATCYLPGGGGGGGGGFRPLVPPLDPHMQCSISGSNVLYNNSNVLYNNSNVLYNNSNVLYNNSNVLYIVVPDQTATANCHSIILTTLSGCGMDLFIYLFALMVYIQVNNFSVISGLFPFFLG